MLKKFQHQIFAKHLKGIMKGAQCNHTGCAALLEKCLPKFLFSSLS